VTFIEKQIRNIFIKCIKEFAKDYEVKENEVQLMFSPLTKENDNTNLGIKYQLFIDYAFKKELDYQDISGIWYLALQSIVEQYITQLFTVINMNDSIEYENIRIIIQAPKQEENTFENLVAHLYNKNRLIRELKVSEFVA